MEKNIDYKAKVLYTLAVLLVLFFSIFTLHKSVNVLWSDEWFTPGNLIHKDIISPDEVGIKDFFAQHNESRKIFPKIIYYISYKIGVFDTRIGVFIRIFISVITIFLLFLLFKDDCTINTSLKTVISCILIFIPTQAGNQLFGLQFITAVPSFCIILIIFINKYIKSINYNLLISIITCLISTFSFANGIVIWVICNPLVFRLINITYFNRWHLFIFNSIFFITTVIYFISYEHPSSHPGFQEGLSDPVRALKYFCMWFFSPFLIGNSFSVFASLILTLLYFLFLFYISRKVINEFLNERIITWNNLCGLMMIIYSCVSCIITTLGRSGFGYMAGHGAQYPSFALWAHLGIIILILSKSINLNYHLRTIIISSYSLLSLLSMESGFTSFQAWSLKMKQAKLTIENLNICPNNSLISELHPNSYIVRMKSKSFASAGLIKYQNNNWILDLEKTDAHFPGESGWVTISKNNHSFNFNGWGSIPKTKKPPDYILIGVHDRDQFIPITFILPHVKRPDVQKALKVGESFIYGFNKTIEMPKHLINKKPYCYSINATNKRYYKISEI